MKTGNNKATNNFIIRLWSAEHYSEARDEKTNIFRGSIIDVKDEKSTVFFHSVAELLSALEKLYDKAEKNKQNEVK